LTSYKLINISIFTYNPYFIYDVVNDVAILKVETLITFSKSVSAIPLIIDTKPGFGTAVTALGWGRRQDASTFFTLQKVTTSVINVANQTI
jgi:hypothetical protein